MRITVKAARVNAGMSQEEVAKHLGLSKNGYTRKENGQSKFYIDEIVSLSDLFNVKLENFFETMCRKKTQEGEKECLSR
ncbi:helix-turn-helix transcriptional regulator [Paenibacillus wenxiniae]|uniref:Helix-turn-helix transcriptional regulator n=1 Tax=Paenibacillus wenxiniae TaxID=1636843 RepID=A0ABW4RMD3_9BACL